MKFLKKLSFILSILGIALLLLMLTFPAEKIGDLDDTELKEKVIFSGKVEGEREISKNFKILNIHGIEVACECKGNYLDEEAEIEGVVEEFNGKKQIRALRISISD